MDDQEPGGPDGFGLDALDPDEVFVGFDELLDAAAQALDLGRIEFTTEDAVLDPVAEALQRLREFGAPPVVGDVVTHEQMHAGLGGCRMPA